jgi:hypothetical protein
MKKLATLLLAAGLVFGAATGASAIDFKASGVWDFQFNMGQNGNFSGGNGQTGWRGVYNSDEFDAVQRLRLKLDAVASESLSGTVYFEIGTQRWGQAGNGRGARAGGSFGADATDAIKVKQAYLDWMVPQTDLKVRMGIQGIGLPSFTTVSQVLNEDIAGVSLSYKVNDNVALTAVWARPYNDNYAGGYENASVTDRSRYMDNVDAFALVLPLTFDGVKVTPWGMYAAIGPNAFKANNAGGWNNFGMPSGNLNAGAADTYAGMVPAVVRHKDGTNLTTGKRFNTYGDAWWLGLTGQVTAFDPFRIAWDVNYGEVRYDDARFNRHGWLASLLFEYKLDWAVPGIYGWYGTGDDDDPSNGSERMPFVGQNSTQNQFSQFAFHGSRGLMERDSILGKDMAGTWGIGVRLKDMKFVEDLKHTVYVNYIGGTNNTRMVRYKGAATFTNAYGSGAGREGMYLTTNDHVWDIGIANTYQMYENLIVFLDASYIVAGLDQGNKVWGRYAFNGQSDQIRDPWNVNLGFYYSF